MDYRRIPFQFSTTDPLKRQEELQRRFGIPVNKGNMYVDPTNPGEMGTRSGTSSVSNSPRLQHRAPIFADGQSVPSKPSGDAQNVDCGKKSRVRVVPIEIMGDNNKRRYWPPSSSEPINQMFNGGISIPVERCHSRVPSSQSPKAARVCNIPVQVEGSDGVIRPKSKTESSNHPEIKLNGCSASKVKMSEKKESTKANEKKESPEQLTLKKICNVEEKLQGYQVDIEKFSGTNKDKQYRFLDEMLTRCMLELDGIDTMGLETIRLARKAAVKKVQASLDLLESKAIAEDKQDAVSKEPMEVVSSPDGTLEDIGDTSVAAKCAESEKVKCEETAFTETNMDAENREVENTNVEMTDTLPELINEKVESISIMDMDTNIKSEKEPVSDTINAEETEQAVQITEIDEGVENIADLDTEPIIEEPLSTGSKDENFIGMELDSCNNESEFKSDTSSVQISEMLGDAGLNPNKLEVKASGLLDQNLGMEVSESLDIPIVIEQTELSSDNINSNTIDQSRMS